MITRASICPRPKISSQTGASPAATRADSDEIRLTAAVMAQVAQAARNPPGRLRLQWCQAGPGFAGLGQHNRFAAMGGIDQA